MSIGQAVQHIRKASVAALLAAAIAGCGGGGEEAKAPEPPAPADTQGPSFASQVAAPNSLRFTGGRVTIMADVTDSGGVSHVWAVVTWPDSSTETVDLSGTGGNSYSAPWNAPGNPEVGGPTLSYAIRIYGSDAAGNVTSVGPLTITVGAVDAPPPLPN